MKADVILPWVCGLDDRVNRKVSAYATDAKIIHIEIDPAEINKIIRADVPVLGNAKKC